MRLLFHSDVAAGHQHVAVFKNFIDSWLVHFKVSVGQLCSVEAIECVRDALKTVEVTELLIVFDCRPVLAFRLLELTVDELAAQVLTVTAAEWMAVDLIIFRPSLPLLRSGGL